VMKEHERCLAGVHDLTLEGFVVRVNLPQQKNYQRNYQDDDPRARCEFRNHLNNRDHRCSNRAESVEEGFPLPALGLLPEPVDNHPRL
jgi:hypothetical protein